MLKKQNWIHKLARQGLFAHTLRNALIVVSTALLTSCASLIGNTALGFLYGAQRQDYMLYTLREMAAPLHLIGRNAWGPWLNPAFVLTPILICSFLLIYQCFHLSMQKDVRLYALMSVSGLTAKQRRAVALRQGQILWGFGMLAGLPASLLSSFGMLLFIRRRYNGPDNDIFVDTEGLSGVLFFWSPMVFVLASLAALAVVLLGAVLASGQLRRISPAAALSAGAGPLQVTFQEVYTAAAAAAWQAVKASIQSWYIWNRLQKTKKYYLTEEARRQTAAEAKRARRKERLEKNELSAMQADVFHMAFKNALRSVRLNYGVILSLCAAILIFCLTNHWFSQMNARSYADTSPLDNGFAMLRDYDFILINATCRGDYFDPVPPPEIVHVFNQQFLDELSAREGIAVSTVELTADMPAHEYGLKTLTEDIIYLVCINAEQAHLRETEAYLTERFQGSYQVWIDNRALTVFQAEAQVVIARLFGMLLAFVVALTGLLGFINSSVIGIEGRKGELATLRSVGMTSRQLRRMLLLEGLFLFIPVPVLTAPLLIPASAPGLWISVYTITGLLLSVIPYLAYAPEQKKSISKTLQEWT